MALRSLVQGRGGAVVLVAALALTLIALWLGRPSTPHRVVVVVVVGASLSVVVSPCSCSSSTALLSVSFLPPWPVLIIGIVLNNKIHISKGRKLVS